MDVKEFGQSIKITLAFYLFSLVVVGIGAWYVSDVHTRFQLQNEKISTLRDRIEYVNTRINTKHEQQDKPILKLQEQVRLLERPNTDK